jgi:hypothetical protein
MNMKKSIILPILAISILVPLYLAHDAHASTPTQITLTASKNPTFPGIVGFTAKVSPSAATGTVTFVIDGTAQPPVTLSGGTAVAGIVIATPGTHQITAKYSGDSTYAASTSPAITQTINKATITVTPSPNPSVYGQLVTFTITVSPSNAPGMFRVLVDNRDGTISWKSAMTGGGVYTYTTSQIPGGPHSISFSLLNGLSSLGYGTTEQTVHPAPTVTTITASPNPTTFGTWIKLTTAVSPNAGGVQFLVDGSPYGAPQGVNGGLSIPFGGGTHQVVAKFLGSQNYAASTSPPITVTVNKVATTTIVHASAASLSYNGAQLAPQLIIAVTVTPNLTVIPSTGTIQITIDGKTGLPAQINKGGYTFSGSPATLSKGVHHVSAKYSGDSNYMPSSSLDTTFTVS